jgi:N-acylneuraminate cytidylyltransferase/CMP-N,N'-diacetyllegionaminic acid synthase
VALVGGKPLIAWTIDAALKSKSVKRVLVSTDDEEIAQISRQWGAEVPFMRPVELAQDNSPHLPVVMHAIDWVNAHESTGFEQIVLLQPTSPLRTAEDIDNALNLLQEKNADSVVSVSEAHSHPFLVRQVSEDGRLQDFMPTPSGYLARQNLPPVYAINGAVYVVRRDVLMEQQTFYTNRTYAYLMPTERSLDIDTPWDLHLANLILSDRK